jgi:hypothetical protein
MSALTLFMKQNKAVKENTKYAATKSLLDENGEPLLWEIKPLSTKDDEKIKEQCTMEVPVKGKPNLYRPKLNTTQYLGKMLAASIVYPDLLNAELQDSYGVKTPDDLLKEMVDDPGEYNDFGLFVQKFNGFNVSLEEKVDEAKN